MNAGLIGGILGGFLGVVGGVIGTYFSIKNTGSPEERAFMIKAAAVFWTCGIIFIALLLLLSSPYKMVSMDTLRHFPAAQHSFYEQETGTNKARPVETGNLLIRQKMIDRKTVIEFRQIERRVP